MEFTLRIEKLGIVEDSEITLKPFTLIYGENNLNKSYILLALFFIHKLLSSQEITWEEQRSPILNQKDLKFFRISKKKAMEFIRSLKLNQKLKIYVDNELKKAKDFLFITTSNFEKFFNEKINNLLPSFYLDALSVPLELSKDWKINVKFNSSAKNTKNILILPLNENQFIIFFKDDKDKLTLTVKGYTEIVISSLGNKKIEIRNSKEKNFLKHLYDVITSILFGKKASAVFLPPSRGCISDFSKALALLPFFEATKKVIPGLYRDIIVNISPFFPREVKNKNAEMGLEIFRKLFEFEVIQTRYGINFKDLKFNLEGDIAYASSSIKELTSLYLLLKKGFSGSIYIEEPELHLHPKNQIKMAMFLSTLVNLGYKVAITTHSDFLVSMLGKLIALKSLKDKNSKVFRDIIEKLPIKLSENFLLEKKKVGVYWFKAYKGRIKIEKIPLTEEGIPLKAFREAIKTLYEISGILEEVED